MDYEISQLIKMSKRVIISTMLVGAALTLGDLAYSKVMSALPNRPTCIYSHDRLQDKWDLTNAQIREVELGLPLSSRRLEDLSRIEQEVSSQMALIESRSEFQKYKKAFERSEYYREKGVVFPIEILVGTLGVIIAGEFVYYRKKVDEVLERREGIGVKRRGI